MFINTIEFKCNIDTNVFKAVKKSLINLKVFTTVHQGLQTFSLSVTLMGEGEPLDEGGVMGIWYSL